MSWNREPRQSFTHVSTHQTYVGKALYEHAPNCATIAAVACMSSSLLKSSLGPNLLALILIDNDTVILFDKIFLEHNPHMQLTQKLGVACSKVDDSKKFIVKLKSNGPLFSSSLLQANIDSEFLSLFEGFRALRSLTLKSVAQNEQLPYLKSLPSLEELELQDCINLDDVFFKALGDLENNRNLTSLDISFCIPLLLLVSRTRSDPCDLWCSEGFQKDFCGRLLSKNRLTKLNWDFWNRMNAADEEAFVNAGMTNLLELKEGVPAKLIRGAGFGNLRILCFSEASNEDLVNIGNHCLLLEVLEPWYIRGGNDSFLSDNNLVDGAFKLLRELNLRNTNLGTDGTGFARLHSLEKLSIVADGSFLPYLPNPDRLRLIVIRAYTVCAFSSNNLHRFINLEDVGLQQFQLSREDILSFALFQNLKRISLSACGTHIASSELFRVLCPQLPNLEKLSCYGEEPTGWTEEDVEAILNECKYLQELRFEFGGRRDCQRMTLLKKKYRGVTIHGALQKESTVEHESGSRREREE